MQFKFFKTSLLLAATLLTISSCSNDAIVDDASKSPTNLIAYGVNTPGSSRAATVYNSGNKPSDIYVWAAYAASSTSESVYFNMDHVTKNPDAYKGTGTNYWPSTGALNFYAIAGITPVASNWDWNNFSPKYAFENDATQDLLFALTGNVERPADPSTYYVSLNFQHALAQIAFKVRVDNPNLYVNVETISVKNTYKNGTLNIGEHPVWDFGTTSAYADYTANFGKSVAHYKNETDGENNYIKVGAVAADANDVLLLMPSDYTAWAGGTTPKDNETYFAITCKIYNSLDGINSNVCLWDGTIYIPATFEWEMGYKYTYTFVFGNGNGGYDGDDPTKNVLYPIQYEWTCDDWQNVADSEVTLNSTAN